MSTTAGPSAQPNPGFAERIGVLMATGLIVGESLFGVAFAAIVAERAAAMRRCAAGRGHSRWAMPLGILLFAGAIVVALRLDRGSARPSR